MTRETAATLIIGGGVIGLSCAATLARDGVSTIVLDDARPGTASASAAGMLAPGVDRADGPEHDFATAARARFPAFVEWLRSATGIAVPLNTRGILQVALTPAGVRGLRGAMPATATWLDADALHALEPALKHALGAVHHPLDGAVDNVILLEALRMYCVASDRVRMINAAVVSLDSALGAISVRATNGRSYSGERVVLAAGAWAAGVVGFPRRLPVAPVRGQMLAYAGRRVRHVIFGPRGYVIPREVAPASSRATRGETLVGATTERVGFDASTTGSGGARLRSVGAEILPELRDEVPLRHWAGLRPMTPDQLPIIGPEPSEPRLLYATGHSRNGILMAPLTGECISALIRAQPVPVDLMPFSIARFAG